MCGNLVFSGNNSFPLRSVLPVTIEAATNRSRYEKEQTIPVVVLFPIHEPGTGICYAASAPGEAFPEKHNEEEDVAGSGEPGQRHNEYTSNVTGDMGPKLY